MTPFYADDLTTLYHGDCLDVLDELATAGTVVHAVVMDPPYASGARTEAGRTSSGSMVRGAKWASKPLDNDQMTTPGFVWLMRHVAMRARPLLVDGASVLSFIDWRQWPNLLGAVESANLRVNGQVVWDKRSYGLGNGYRAQHELVLHASKGTPRIVDRDVGSVIACARDTATNHPSPKPLGLMETLLRVVADAGEVILDPFAGAGATLVAAKRLGMRSIGIELDQQHCATAAGRLRQDTLLLG